MLCGVFQLTPPESPRFKGENGVAGKSKRSKPEGGPGEELVYHPVKLSRSDLYRPPTAEELNQLKEAESLFHCSLLKMQVRSFSSPRDPKQWMHKIKYCTVTLHAPLFCL